MSRGLDEVEASVDPVVDELVSIDPVLLVEVGIETSLDVVEDRLPALRVVDEVAKPGCIDDGELEPDTGLFDVCRDGFDVDRLWPVEGGYRLLGLVECRVEERVDER